MAKSTKSKTKKKKGKASTSKKKTTAKNKYTKKSSARAAEKRKDKASKQAWANTKAKAKAKQTKTDNVPTGLKLTSDGDSSHTVRASWKISAAKKKYTDSFQADWEVSKTGKDGSWKSDGVDNIDVLDNASGTYQATHTAGETWKYIHVRVRAKSKSHKVTGTVTNYSVKEKTTGRGKNKKTTYSLTADKDKKEQEYFYFGGGDGYGSWSKRVRIVNPAWEETASEKEKTDTENRTGNPSPVSNLTAEYIDGQDLGQWYISWEYPDDDHIIQRVELFESTDNGATWASLASWSDKGTTSFYRTETPGTNVIFKVTLYTDGGQASATTGGAGGSSSELVGTPNTPTIDSVECGENSVTVNFTTSGTAGTSAEIYYSQTRSDAENPGQSSNVSTASFDYRCYDQSSFYTIGNFDDSGTWYFSMRLKSDNGYSGVSNVVSTLVGSTADPPTPTFDAGSTVEQGRTVRLTWIHNCADGSQQTNAHVKVTANGKTLVDADTNSANGYYDLDTSSIPSGSTVVWQVCTAGANQQLGKYCAAQSFEVYMRPHLSMSLSGGSTLTSLPLVVDVASGDVSQDVIEWSVTIRTTETAQISDIYGDDLPLAVGTEIYRERIVNGDDEYGTESMQLAIGAIDADWPANCDLSIEVGALMSSGLMAYPVQSEFSTNFGQTDVSVLATVTPGDMWTAQIVPEVLDADGKLSAGHTVSVYRIDDDGYTAIAQNIANTQPTLVDTYPNFGQCYYRIVANETATDRMTATTVSAYIDEDCILIQWGEPLVGADDGTPETISANWLQLPYNIKISEKRSKDASLKQYIGRRHEVAYYGTLVTQTGSWSADLSHSDDAYMLEQVRELGNYMGDVYVREPTGQGYWAHVDVDNIDSSYDSALQGVALSVTRVDGD